MSYQRWVGTGTDEVLVAGVDTWRRPKADMVRQNLNAFSARGGPGCHWLGGSRSQFHYTATALPVPEWWDVIIDWRHITEDPLAGSPLPLTVQARVEVYTLSGATSVTPRIRNVTDAADYDGVSYSTATTWGEQVIVIPEPASLGLKRYRLEIIGNNANNGIAGIGQIEVFDVLF